MCVGSEVQLEQRVYYLERDILSIVTPIPTNKTYSNLDQFYPKYLTGSKYTKDTINADTAINLTSPYLLD
jgi:hypothetical protein